MEYYFYRKGKQEMMWMVKKDSEPFHYQVSDKIRERKPNSYFIFKDLLKRCTTSTAQVPLLSLTHTLTHTCIPEINKLINREAHAMYIYI